MSYIFVKNAPITLYRSRETHLWPVGPKKILCAPSGRDFYNTFCKKIVGLGKIYNATLRFFKNMRRGNTWLIKKVNST